MIRSMMNEFELIRTRILSLPKKAEQLADKPALKLGKGSCFKLTTPTAEYGPIKTAGEYKAIAPIAHQRQQARLDLMAHMEGCRRKFDREVLAMLNLNNIFSQRFWSLQ